MENKYIQYNSCSLNILKFMEINDRIKFVSKNKLLNDLFKKSEKIIYVDIDNVDIVI